MKEEPDVMEEYVGRLNTNIMQGGKYAGHTMVQIVAMDLGYADFMLEKQYWTRRKVSNVIRIIGVDKLQMTFGKYKGTSTKELFELNPEYIDYLLNNKKAYPYILSILKFMYDNELYEIEM